MNVYQPTEVTPQHIGSRVTLHNGVEMPVLGLGVFKVEAGQEMITAIKAAVKLGYRSIDTASIYGNEAGVGQAVQELIEEGVVTREELFITSKAWNADLGYEETLAAYEQSLQRLGLDQLDLYLIHWPVPGKYGDAWRALEKLYGDGRVRAIGVSNFQIHHLEDLLATAEIVPVINQVELHPKLTQYELQQYCADHGIRLEAWSPLMQGQLLEHPVLATIAEQHGKQVAQIILRWNLQRGVITIPKSISAKRIADNAQLFDFVLTDEQMQQIDALNEHVRVGPDPDHIDF
ncbi:aldo/keto reductase [Paenibacillus hunanensis]|uniref:aldo/keto reductase n=1 Tax=Paenibacillus hunanensis TaxID=539262 RepID=UPI00202715FC|nr:aldo/keto reductase [Paenibacillus hunanensis]MCL9661464.1 aldo/keto reductase [Paenibacillus hunanensis]